MDVSSTSHTSSCSFPISLQCWGSACLDYCLCLLDGTHSNAYSCWWWSVLSQVPWAKAWPADARWLQEGVPVSLVRGKVTLVCIVFEGGHLLGSVNRSLSGPCNGIILLWETLPGAIA